MQTLPAPADNPADRPAPPRFASQPASPEVWERAVRAEAARRMTAGPGRAAASLLPGLAGGGQP
jgi:hypothetical protein